MDEKWGMKGRIELNKEGIELLEEKLFPRIAEGRCVLFLGSGSSVTSDYKFLGKEILDYYSDKLGITPETSDLVEFMDFVETLPSFERSEFESYVTELLKRLKPAKAHDEIVRLDWMEIITTNLDDLIEQAYYKIQGTKEENKEIKSIRSIDEYYGFQSKDQVRYIKLNGCISDKSKFRYVFSSKDFQRTGKYYSGVLNSLGGYSDQIKFLSIGYSYTDGLAKGLLKKIEDQNLQTGKWTYNIDPFVSDERIHFYNTKNIVTISCTSDEFFNAYKKWETEKGSEIIRRKKIKFYSPNENELSINIKSSLRLNGCIEQLNKFSKTTFVTPLEYFKGTIPDYGVILRNYDVMNLSMIERLERHLVESENRNDNLLPYTVLTGSFGIGKSTTVYRLICDAQLKMPGTIAFEIIEPDNIRGEDLIELFDKSGAMRIILHCPAIERPSSYKEFLTLRNKISTMQPDQRVHFITSARENVYARLKMGYNHRNVHEINIEESLEKEEVNELIKKLEKSGAINVPDQRSFRELSEKIATKYKGSTFVTLSEIVPNNYFNQYIVHALSEIPKEARIAVGITSLVYRYGIPLPATILQRIISGNWETFTENVLKVDCKELLIHSISDKTASGQPDMFFKTKHPILSEKIVGIEFKGKDKLFKAYDKILTNLPPGNYYSKLAVDLIRTLRLKGELEHDKINKLFDNCSRIFERNNDFILHYSINLQSRGTVRDLEKAIELIMVSTAEDSLSSRDHRLIHRRGVICFDLAKQLMSSNSSKCEYYIEEARELFQIKLIEDRFSSYSFEDYMRLEFWILQKGDLSEEEKIETHLVLQDLFDKANNAVFENDERIKTLEKQYIEFAQQSVGVQYKTLEEYYAQLYNQEKSRHLALIFRINEKVSKGEDVVDLISELEGYDHLDIVGTTLFKYYGRNLYSVENRMKFLTLSKKNQTLAQKDPLAFHFYSYILESYNRNFHFSFDHLKTIQTSFVYYNPYLNEVWVDDSTLQAEIFSVNIVLDKGRIKANVIGLNRIFQICRNTSHVSSFENGQKFEANLLFYLRGIKVKLLQQIKS